MNRVKEIERINNLELQMGGNGVSGSWHDEYRDSAYIYIGGLPDGITEGDLITICSQFGEISDVNMPRDKDTGKTRGFGFVMYEDQRSTVLAVDNLNGGKVVDRIIRVDHVKNYKQPKVMNDEGEMIERDEQSLNAVPHLIRDGYVSDDGTVSDAPDIDPEDPMAAYLLQKRKEEKGKSKKRRREDETPEERRARKERKRAKKDAKARALGDSRPQAGSSRAIEDDHRSRRRDDDRYGGGRSAHEPSRSDRRRDSRTPPNRGGDSGRRNTDNTPPRRANRSPDATPPRRSDRPASATPPRQRESTDRPPRGDRPSNRGSGRDEYSSRTNRDHDAGRRSDYDRRGDDRYSSRDYGRSSDRDRPRRDDRD
ncbi:hypothetical protein DL93DRAFT_2109773 [Clavulina sp. PMI_390]|nr:hypothetical protein DL93DRAFT_2109773 [Clavulina sp. PMI_390]